MEGSVSMADTVASLNYKWVRDSWVSQNHPTVDASSGSTTIVRGQLESHRKEQIRRMAKILDEYKSPVEYRNNNNNNKLLTSKDKTTVMPQYIDTPKSDSSAIASKVSKVAATPVLSHFSMSPTPTSQTTSWRKHTMIPHDLSQSSVVNGHLEATSTPMVSSSKSSLNQNSMTERSVKPTNYKAPHMSQIEDSHWQKSTYSKIDLSDLTPSPLRGQQQFFTAKQFDNNEGNTLLVESLRIASPRMGSTPSVRKAVEINQLSYDSGAPTPPQTTARPEENGRSAQQELGNLTAWATAGNLTRNGSIDSQLSKVNSQASSLQRAISSALNDGRARDASIADPFDQLPVDEAIVARYRQSRIEHGNSIAPTGPESALESTTNLRPVERKDHVSEPMKHASPLLGRDSPELDAQGKLSYAGSPDVTRTSHNGMITQVDMEDQSRMTSLLSTIERVSEECSRRGKIIEAMMEEVAHQPEDLTEALRLELHLADQKVESLEERLSSYEAQMNAMRAMVLSLQQQTGSKANAATDTLQPPEEVISFNEAQPIDAEESFRDKISRWNCSLSNVPQILINDSTSHRSRLSKQSANDKPSEKALSQGPARKAGTPGDDTAVESLRRAELEIEHLRTELMKLEGSSLVRPLTADLMPDAKNQSLCPSDRLYVRLHLHRVDELSRNEMGNLLKNILIQLNTPYDDLSGTVISLGQQLAEGNDDVIHECMKLREFAEHIHSCLYNGEHIEGAIASRKCLSEMHQRVERLQRTIRRKQSVVHQT